MAIEGDRQNSKKSNNFKIKLGIDWILKIMNLEFLKSDDKILDREKEKPLGKKTHKG